jgi:acetyl-CoA acetyltransferase
VKVIGKVLQRAGLKPSDVALWEINEAFASVPIAACRDYGLDEQRVNFSGNGCSLGHPIAASGARMVTTLVYELQRRGGGSAWRRCAPAAARAARSSSRSDAASASNVQPLRNPPPFFAENARSVI